MADQTDKSQTRLSRLRQAFKEHTGIRISTATAIVYAALSIVFACKAMADRPKNTVPVLQCVASVCLSGLSAFGAKNNYRSHFNDKQQKAKIDALEESMRQLNERLTLPSENKPQAAKPAA